MKHIVTLAAALLIAGAPAFAYKAGTTRDQATAAVAKKYKQMDADGKGEISATELETFMTRSSAKRGEGPDPAKVARRLKKLDTDGNGTISQAELQAEEMEKFGKADADGNGKIEGAEADPS